MTQRGALVSVPREQWTTLRMAEQFDAVLYLGAPKSITWVGLSPDLCGDAAYLKMRTERLALLGFANGVERLKSFCAAQNKK
jgi:hypothetical protein